MGETGTPVKIRPENEMSEYSAKTLREKMKAKARSLANPGDYYKDQEVSSADWSPAPPLKTEMKTGARPIMKPSSKGTGESYAARDTKKAIGEDMKRGGFKAGGAVKKSGVSIPTPKETLSTKEIVGANPIRPTRGKAENYKTGGKVKKSIGGVLEKISPAYAAMRSIQRGPDEEQQTKSRLQEAAMINAARGAKKGGKIKKAGGGSMLEKMVGKPKGSDYSQVGKMGTANYTQEDKGALNRALKGDDSLPEPAEAAERSGKYQNYKTGGRAERKAGGRTRAKGKTNINIVIAAGRKAGPEAPALDMAGGMPSAPANIPVPMPGAGAPPPAAMPMGGPPGMPAPGLLPGRKAGGRITKIASSYKDMQAGSGSGEGRLQKTDIAKKHHDAPARKAGGKVYSSYKDMDAGAGSGFGRLEKTEIEKKQRARGK
jgi:hypothetical protein